MKNEKDEEEEEEGKVRWGPSNMEQQQQHQQAKN